MRILGLADNHDSGAALVVDGELVAAVGQERLDRVKNSGAFPWDAARTVLEQGGCTPGDVDLVIFGSAYTPSTALRLLPRLHAGARGSGNFSYGLNLYIAYQVALRRLRMDALEWRASEALLRRRMAGGGFGSARVELMDHHEAHAHAAYRSQGADPCLVLTLDAMGDGLSATAWAGRGGRLACLGRQSGRAAINTFYSRITEYLGFTPNRHEGKITGLAAYARPPQPLLAHLEGGLRFQGGRFSTLPVWRWQHPGDRFYRVLERYSREQIAAAAQQVLEKAVCSFVAHQVRRSGLGHLAVAGGIFANVKLNQRIAELPEVRSLFVYPNMGDGGLPAGAALGRAGAEPSPLAHAYLGPAPSVAEMDRALQRAGLERRRPAHLADRVAALLAGGRVVARYGGGMEWGPRALGNRSILYRADDPSVNDWLNERLRRTEFMPFAPLTLADEAPAAYAGMQKAAHAARFMTVCFDCSPDFRRRCPGVVHVDGTARPQVLDRHQNPELHETLVRYRERTGVGTVINTSFNLHEEPIVNSPDDAVRAWRQARLDALVMGPFLVERRSDSGRSGNSRPSSRVPSSP